MIALRGTWYDGRTSTATDAVCRVYGSGEVRVESEEGKPLAERSHFDLKVSSRLAHTPRTLHFPDGGAFESGDNDTVDRILEQHGRSVWSRRLHRLESRWPYILAALLIMAVFLWGGIRYGVPFTARVVAEHLPASAYELAGRQTLTILDRSFLRPSQLPRTTRDRLRDHFKTVLQHLHGPKITVLFRQGGPLGPNAFALPDGTVLFTDEMVRIARHDHELTAVLAHEVGHVVHRHGMRRLVQGSLLGFALLAVTGDVSGSSEIFLGLPVMLTELAYSREFERQADDHALSFLRTNGISPDHFARLMRRIQERKTSKAKGRPPGWTSYLSTHPALEERLRRFEEGAS